MDGWEWVMVGFGAFIFGGLLNLASACWFLAVEYREAMAFPKGWRAFSMSGHILSLLVVTGQIAAILLLLAKQVTAP